MMPLLICAGPRALPTSALAQAYYLAGSIEPVILRPAASAEHNARFAPGTRFIDDEDLAGVEEVRAWLRTHAEEMARFHRAPGWFLQQFIKVAAVAALDTEYVFISDGDTIFSLPLLQEVLRTPQLLATGESHENYDRLLLAFGLAPPSLSCVANGNVFPRHPLLRELATAAGFRAMMEEHVLPSRGQLDFSEYQLVGSLLEPRLGLRPIRLFRRFDLLTGPPETVQPARIRQALTRYDALAIETEHHSSLLKRIGARLFYAAARSW
jgi:hypothetical protein